MEAERARNPQPDQVRTAQYGGGVSPGYPPQKNKAENKTTTIAVDVTRLTMLFNRAQFNEAERLAHRILEMDNRQPLPYAVLGDIARSRGKLNEAAKMFAHAVQMEPDNALYQKRYAEVVRAEAAHLSSAPIIQEIGGTQLFAPLVGGAMVLLGCFYLALSRELPFLKEFAPISTWTLGVVVVLFLSGVAIGSSLATAGMLDRLHTLTMGISGRPAPTMTLVFVAAVNFWAALALFGFLGFSQKSFNLSTTRMLLFGAAATVLLAASAATNGVVDGIQVLLWGGNLVYLGSLAGWSVADSFRG
jgi:tetratricopeptide (TPR) repeat protein